MPYLNPLTAYQTHTHTHSLSKLVGSGWRWKEFTAGATTLHELCASRTPVLAIGSNASPQQLKRKFEKMHVSTLVPVSAVPFEHPCLLRFLLTVCFMAAIGSHSACAYHVHTSQHAGRGSGA